MSSVESLITPQYIYSNICEHMRSQLNVAVLDSSDLKSLAIDRVEIAAFGTRYHFSMVLERETAVTSSIIALTDAKPVAPKLVEETYFGILEETLEPGATRPSFNFQAQRAQEAN